MSKIEIIKSNIIAAEAPVKEIEVDLRSESSNESTFSFGNMSFKKEHVFDSEIEPAASIAKSASASKKRFFEDIQESPFFEAKNNEASGVAVKVQRVGEKTVVGRKRPIEEAEEEEGEEGSEEGILLGELHLKKRLLKGYTKKDVMPSMGNKGSSDMD